MRNFNTRWQAAISKGTVFADTVRHSCAQKTSGETLCDDLRGGRGPQPPFLRLLADHVAQLGTCGTLVGEGEARQRNAGILIQP